MQRWKSAANTPLIYCLSLETPSGTLLLCPGGFYDHHSVMLRLYSEVACTSETRYGNLLNTLRELHKPLRIDCTMKNQNLLEKTKNLHFLNLPGAHILDLGKGGLEVSSFILSFVISRYLTNITFTSHLSFSRYLTTSSQPRFKSSLTKLSSKFFFGIAWFTSPSGSCSNPRICKHIAVLIAACKPPLFSTLPQVSLLYHPGEGSKYKTILYI